MVHCTSRGGTTGLIPKLRSHMLHRTAKTKKVPRSNRLQGLCISTPCPQNVRPLTARKSSAILPSGHLPCHVLREALPSHLVWGWAVPISQGVLPTLSWWTPYITLRAARTVCLYAVFVVPSFRRGSFRRIRGSFRRIELLDFLLNSVSQHLA